MDCTKKVIVFLGVLFCFSCNTKQQEYENSLLYPKKDKYGFDVTYNTNYFSDLTICFNFSCTPSDTTASAIELEVVKFEERYQKKLVHQIKKVDDRYSILVNFKRVDNNYYSVYDAQSDVDAFNVLLKSIDKNPDIQDLLAVHFE